MIHRTCIATLACFVALATACAGEQITVDTPPSSSIHPERAGIVVASLTELDEGATPDGWFESADGTVTGWYFRDTREFDLSKDEVNIPTLERRDQDGVFVANGANYTEILFFTDGEIVSRDVALAELADRKVLDWTERPSTATVRTLSAEIFPDLEAEPLTVGRGSCEAAIVETGQCYTDWSPWKLTYSDDNPDTLVSPDAEGFWDVRYDGFADGMTMNGWYNEYYDDGSTLEQTLSRFEGPLRLSYTWRDATTPQPVDEEGELIHASDGSTEGTITRYDADGVASCVYVIVDNGLYTEFDC